MNTASMVGLVGLKTNPCAYCAPEGAVVLLTRQIAVEYSKSKVAARTLCLECKSLWLIVSECTQCHFDGKHIVT